MKSIVDLEEPTSDYFSLIQIVGSNGKYQKTIFLIMSINWFVAALLLMGTSFLYLAPPLRCDDPSLNTEQCERFVCGLPRQEWKNHIAPKLVQSLSTQFGPYVCQDTIILNFLRSTLYIGVFFGYMIFLFCADNYGRKVSLVLAWGISTIGISILSLSWSMTSASLGLLLAGAGCESSIRIGITFINETVDFNVRQTYSVAMQSSFGITGVLLGILFYVIQQWRVIIIFFCFIPSLLVLVFIMTYFQQTPKFLLKKGGFQTLKAMNRIAQINGINSDYFLKYQDITSYLQKINQSQTKSTVTPLSLFLFDSLRTKTICTSIIFFSITYIYIGPIVIVDKLGINPFLSQVIVSGSQIIAYPLVYLTIQSTSRKDSGEILFTLSAIFTGILIFVHKPEDCNNCFAGYVQIIFIFCSRFCISVYFSIFFIYVPQLFPLSARALGFGIASSAGAISSTSSQIILPYFQQKGYNPMILFTILGIISIYTLKFLPETKDMPLEEQIEEHKKDWSLGQDIKTETNIMIKTAKNHYQECLSYFFPKVTGFREVESEQQG